MTSDLQKFKVKGSKGKFTAWTHQGCIQGVCGVRTN